MHFGVVFLQVPRKTKLTLAEFATVRIFRGVDHNVGSELIRVLKTHRAHCTMMLPEALVMGAGVLVQDRFGKEGLPTHLAAISPLVTVAVHVVFQTKQLVKLFVTNLTLNPFLLSVEHQMRTQIAQRSRPAKRLSTNVTNRSLRTCCTCLLQVLLPLLLASFTMLVHVNSQSHQRR